MSWEDVTQRLDSLCDDVEGLKRNMDELGFYILFPREGKITGLTGIVSRIVNEDKRIYVQFHGVEVPVFGSEYQGNIGTRIKLDDLIVSFDLLTFVQGRSTLEVME